MESERGDGDHYTLHTYRDNAYLAVTAFVTTVAFVPWFPDAALGPRWIAFGLLIPWMVRKSLWLYFLFFSSILFLGLLNTPSVLDGVYDYWHLLLFGLAVLAAPVSMRPVYVGAGLGLAVHAGVLAVQYWLGIELFTEALPISGIFFNRNLGAELAAMVVVGLAGQRLWLLFFPVSTIFIATPFWSRGALLGLASAAGIAVWARSKFWAGLFGIVLVGLLFRFLHDPGRLLDLELRLKAWLHAWKHFSLGGNGLGSYIYAYPWFEFAHNDLVQVAYELGLFGVVAFAGFFAFCLVRGPVTERLVLVAFLVEGTVGFPFHAPATVLIGGLAAGHILRARGWLRDRVSSGKLADQRDSEFTGAGSARTV